MSLHPQATYPVPEETQRVARAAFPRGNIYMQVADRLGTIYHDTQLCGAFPHTWPTRRRAGASGARHGPSASLRKASRIVKPPMPSAAALIGNMSWGWN